MRTLLTLFIIAACTWGARADALTEAADSLRAYIATLDARVGVVVMADNGGLAAGSQEPAPMLSVMKFPLALAVADKVRRTDATLDTPAPDGRSLRQLLDLALRVSDNEAADILIDYVGGTDSVQSFLNAQGRIDTRILRTEADMHRDLMLSYDNTSTPFSMARMMRDYDWHADDDLDTEIKSMLEACETGAGRLPAPLGGTGARIGHKTGTGPVNPVTGRIIAVNDAGYIHTPEGLHYAIAVFVTDSAYGLEETETIIARISAIVYNAVRAKGPVH